MPWNAPYTFAPEETPPAQLLNEQIRDNITALHSPQAGEVTWTSDKTTTATGFDPISGLSITLVSTGRDMLVALTGAAKLSVSGTVVLDFAQDGVRLGGATPGTTRTTADGNISFSRIVTGLTSGVSYTFTVEWRVTSGTGTLYANGQFYAREI